MASTLIKPWPVKLLQDLADELSEVQGVACDVFKVTRILDRLNFAYHMGVKNNPSLEHAIMIGDFRITVKGVAIGAYTLPMSPTEDSIILNLWSAYVLGLKSDPNLEEAVLNGEFEIS